MSVWKNRLAALERSRSAGRGPLTVLHDYGSPLPEVPPGHDPVTVVQEVIVLAVEPDGTEYVVDPWNPDGPAIVVRPGEPLPDRTPRGEGR